MKKTGVAELKPYISQKKTTGSAPETAGVHFVAEEKPGVAELKPYVSERKTGARQSKIQVAGV